MNRLASVSDGIVNSVYADDIEGNQTSTNYEYNEIGQLISDEQEGIASIEWTVTGKIKRINYTAAAKHPSTGKGRKDLQFIYDPMDRRIVKMVYEEDDRSKISYTYYSYDAQGNVMAVYDREKWNEEIDITEYPSGISSLDGYEVLDKLVLEEHHLYL